MILNAYVKHVGMMQFLHMIFCLLIPKILFVLCCKLDIILFFVIIVFILQTFLCYENRLLTVGLQSDESITWAEALQSEHTLCQILWIAENTLNLQLLEKVMNTLY